MNCFDCAAIGHTEPAVAVCADCGAAVCPRHAQVRARWLTRAAAINRTVVVETPARTIRCTVCQAARDDVPGAPAPLRPSQQGKSADTTNGANHDRPRHS